MKSLKVKAIIETLILGIIWAISIRRNFHISIFCLLSIFTYSWAMYRFREQLSAVDMKLRKVAEELKEFKARKRAVKNNNDSRK